MRITRDVWDKTFGHDFKFTIIRPRNNHIYRLSFSWDETWAEFALYDNRIVYSNKNFELTGIGLEFRLQAASDEEVDKRLMNGVRFKCFKVYDDLKYKYGIYGTSVKIASIPENSLLKYFMDSHFGLDGLKTELVFKSSCFIGSNSFLKEITKIATIEFNY